MMATVKPPRSDHSHAQDVKHLFQAIRKGKAHLTRFMMAASSALLNCSDTDGRTPLMECCFIKEEVTRVNMVKIVRDAGADVNQKDPHGRTALIHACQQRCNDVVRILIMHCSIVPDIEDDEGNTALIHSTMVGNDVAVELLVRNFRRLGLQVDHFNKDGFTALQLACKSGFLQCAKLLAVRGKANLTLKDKVFQMTPMELCIREGYQKSEVEFLKPLTKFYKVAKLTTTIVKCRKRSVGQESTNSSLSSLRVSPIKVVKKVKQKSLGLLKKTIPFGSDKNGTGAGPSDTPSMEVSDENLLLADSAQKEKRRFSEENSEFRGERSKSLSSASPKKPITKSTTSKKSCGSLDTDSKQPSMTDGRQNPNSKTLITQTKSMPLPFRNKLSEEKGQLSVMQSVQQERYTSAEEWESTITSTQDEAEFASGDSGNDIDLSESEDSLTSPNSVAETLMTLSGGGSPNNFRDDLDTNTSPSTVFSSTPTPGSSDSASTLSNTKRSTQTHSDRSATSSSMTTECSESSIDIPIPLLSPQTDVEYIDLNGCDDSTFATSSICSSAFVNSTTTKKSCDSVKTRGRDSASPQTEVDFLPHDDSYSDEKCSREFSEEISEDSYCDSMDPFITEQFLKMAEPVNSHNPHSTSSNDDKQRFKTPHSSALLKRDSSTKSCDLVVSNTSVNTKTGTKCREVVSKDVVVSNSATVVVVEEDARSVASCSPETIIDTLDALELSDSYIRKKQHSGDDVIEHNDVLSDVDESCEYDI